MIRKVALICAWLSISTSYADDVKHDIQTSGDLEFREASSNYRLGLPENFHTCINKAEVFLAKVSQCLIDEEINQRDRLDKAYRALSNLLTLKRSLELKLTHERWVRDIPKQCAVLSGFIGSGQDKQNRITNCVVYEYAKRSVDYERYVIFKDAVLSYVKDDENAQPFAPRDAPQATRP